MREFLYSEASKHEITYGDIDYDYSIKVTITYIHVDNCDISYPTRVSRSLEKIELQRMIDGAKITIWGGAIRF